MSVGKLQNHMRLQAMLAASGRTSTRIGIVTSLDTANYCAKVELQPAGQETGWLPIMTLWAGNGWGLMAPPPIGSQVKIDFLEGSVDVGMVAGMLFSTEDMPLNAPSGEAWLVHKSGSYFKLTNDGKLLMNSTAEIDVGNLAADLHTVVIDTFMALFNNHKHAGVQTGGSVSGLPTTPMDASHFTTILKAN